MTGNSYETGTATFEQDVVEASRRAPVLVDFWAPWCGPCRALTPILEKLAEEYQGKFLLAKINTDENPEIATQFGVRGIPNVKAFVDGNLVDEFVGALPESGVRQFIARILPSPIDQLRSEARKAVAAGDFEAAETNFRKALELDPGSTESGIDLAELLVARQAFDDAEPFVEAVPEELRDERTQQLAAKIAFWKKEKDLPDLAALRARVAADPKALAARRDLADRLVIERDLRGALDELLEVVHHAEGAEREAAREAMVRIFTLAADQPDLVADYRRQLARALH
ncbi:MAG: thioredoxin [Betaproteobacteria bacterium]|jgi:putative thioredoxin|nr:thioredoxin [Betaproteobacteria bacterium]